MSTVCNPAPTVVAMPDLVEGERKGSIRYVMHVRKYNLEYVSFSFVNTKAFWLELVDVFPAVAETCVLLVYMFNGDVWQQCPELFVGISEISEYLTGK